MDRNELKKEVNLISAANAFSKSRKSKVSVEESD